MFLELLQELLDAGAMLRNRLGEHWCGVQDTVVSGPSSHEPRSRFEHEFFFELKGSHQLKAIGARLFVEDWDPIDLVSEPEYDVYVDPKDGTANTCRWQDTGSRDIGSEVACVIAIAPHKSDLHFGDFIASGALDLRGRGSHQMWLAEKGRGALTGSSECGTTSLSHLNPVRNYHRHSPLLACEFYRHINWATRLLVNQAVEWSDMASSFINMLRVPLGETDCYFNNVFPEISDEGQRGHELGAIMPFLRELQGFAIDTRTMKDLSQSLFTFDGMTPILIAVDKATADYYVQMIEENFGRQIQLPNGEMMNVLDLITALHSGVGQQRWGLRPLPSDKA